MFYPARMTRIVAGGHKQHMEGLIDLLHREGVLHLEDFADPTGTTGIGTPLEAGDEASGQLVRVRGLLKSLDAEDAVPSGQDPHRPAEIMKEAEAELVPVIDQRAEARAELAAVRQEMQQLAPYEALDLELSAVTGLKSVSVFVGQVRGDPRAALERLGADVQTAEHEGRTVIAAVVPAAKADEAERALVEHGFAAAQLPEASGTPAARLHALHIQQQALQDRIAEVSRRMDGLRTAWAGRLARLDERLRAEVERTQAPLHFAVTETTFHAEGWVPVHAAAGVQAAVQERFGDALYIEVLGDAPRGHDVPAGAGHGAAGHGMVHGAAHPESTEEHHDIDPKDEAPVHLQNKGLATPYEFLLGLLSRPRYQEIDPTKLMLIFFPLFFGLMVGDVLVGLVIMLVGWLLKSHKVFGIGGPSVGRALVMGGFISVLVGAFVFGEALGIHFVVDDHGLEEGEPSWESIIYGKDAAMADQGFPTEGFIHKTGAAGTPHNGSDSPVHDAAYRTHAETTEEAKSIFAPHSDTHLSIAGVVNLGYYSKVHDVETLLLWSIIIGIAHIVIGLLLGYRNVRQAHGTTLAIQEKASWLVILGSVPLIALGATGAGTAMLAVGVGALVVGTTLLWIGTAKVLGVGFIALLEIPGLFGNLLSYTRIAAIGASKAGMAIAFLSIGFGDSGEFTSPVGWAVYLLGMVAITLLAILSGGLQSLRLQFVEFFQKFYTGGGRPYVPFGRRAP